MQHSEISQLALKRPQQIFHIGFAKNKIIHNTSLTIKQFKFSKFEYLRSLNWTFMYGCCGLVNELKLAYATLN